jgi:hypothetical protein
LAEPGLPLALPELEKGWIAVPGGDAGAGQGLDMPYRFWHTPFRESLRYA